MSGFDTRGKREDPSAAPGFRLVAGAAIMAAAAIFLSLAMQVQLPPDALMLVHP